MRFIIHEMAYEKPLTAGKWKYELDGQATGAVEEWRLTSAVDGYRFLRVDLDARAASSGRSTIYHLTLDEYGAPVQLKYRYWATGLEIIGTVLLEEDAVIVTRETTGGRHEEIVGVPPGYAFWFPSTAGLSLLARHAGSGAQTAVTLHTATDDRDLLMNPITTTVTVRAGEPDWVEVNGNKEKTQQLIIRWQNQQRMLWVDGDNWPIKMERDDGLTAVTARTIHYQQITKPGIAEEQQSARS